MDSLCMYEKSVNNMVNSLLLIIKESVKESPRMSQLINMLS